MDIALTIIFALIIFALYVLPMFIICFRRCPIGRTTVFILNGMFGWTVIGWAMALSIALTAPTPEEWKKQQAETAALVAQRKADRANRPRPSVRVGESCGQTARSFAIGFTRGLVHPVPPKES